MGTKGHPCHYCGGVATTDDHIVPKAVGGPNERGNRVPSCVECNARKADSLPTCGCARCREALRLYRPGAPRNRRSAQPARRDVGRRPIEQGWAAGERAATAFLDSLTTTERPR